MRLRRCKRVRLQAPAIRRWPVWDLPAGLAVFVVAVIFAYVTAFLLAASAVVVVPRDLLLFGALLLCMAATVELTRRAGENIGLTRDVYLVWDLPLVVLLPPVYALGVPAFRYALMQWRVRRVPVYRRVFSAAAVGLSYVSAWATFHAVAGGAAGQAGLVTVHAAIWVLAVAAAAAVQWSVNTAILLPAIKCSDPTVRVRELLTEREGVRNDIAEVCVAVLVALGIAVTPITIVFALPFVTLLQRSFRHEQLVTASRVDSKTGLLNAGTWEREAAAEVARAVRTRAPLAVALIDLDHFKAVNDRNGHLVGDRALKAVARTLTLFLREYDLVGRFGGEEFALLLPQTAPVDAYRIAERIRAHIAATPIDVGDSRSEPVELTVSVGVASLGARWSAAAGTQLTDLLAGADRALYQAKRDGRDRVCVLTENAAYATRARAVDGFSGDGPGLSADGSGFIDPVGPPAAVQDIPEEWRISRQGLADEQFPGTGDRRASCAKPSRGRGLRAR